jgi:hypothetical protein
MSLRERRRILTLGLFEDLSPRKEGEGEMRHWHGTQINLN